jgi:prepilin peptidase CpaA
MFELSALPESLARVAAHLREVILFALVLTAAWIDWRTYRIPNWLTLSGLAVALVYNASSAPGSTGILPALGGAAIGLAVLLPLWVVRVMGAGDVKLMAMVGAFLGSSEVLYAVVLTFVAGGIAAIGFALWTRSTGRVAFNINELIRGGVLAAASGRAAPMPSIASVGKLPYGISICAGTIAWLALKQLG